MRSRIEITSFLNFFPCVRCARAIEDEVVIVTGRLYSNTRNCSVEPIIDEVLKARGIKPSPLDVKTILKQAWRQHKGIILKNEEELSHHMLVVVPKECLEKKIGEILPDYN